MGDVADGVVVFGRVSYDLNPLQAQTPLEDVETFERSVGGFGGNVSTGLARLGVPTAIVSGVGDDPHGRYVRRWLDNEGVDTSMLLVHPNLRTALAFYESWPPDRFPITLFRSPTAPDWEIAPDQIPMDRLVNATMVVVSGTGLARPASFETTRALIGQRFASRSPQRRSILDLDWRPMAWSRPAEYAARVVDLLPWVEVVIGGDEEFAAAGLTPESVAADGTRLVIVKHGPRGASIATTDGFVDVPGLEVEVSVGLGAGDAFIAAFVAALFEGRTVEAAVRRANTAGAIVASRPMCSPAMPRTDEIDALLLDPHADLASLGRIAASTT
jgi:5-dehydro-2-deoxygluconokinase